MKIKSDSGVVLIAVVCFAAITAILALGLLAESGNQLKLANRHFNMEQAFYVAEGGAERAVSYITRVGVTTTTNITGSIGNGNYMAFIVPGGGSHTLSGSLGINPNNSPDNEFVLIKPDGTAITRDDLAGDITEYDSAPCVYYSGPAVLVHVKPKGAGTQNTLAVDGAAFTVDNGATYDFVGDMAVVIQNDSRNNGNHRPNGNWFLGAISGTDVAIEDSSGSSAINNEEFYEIHSIGTVNGIRRNVILNGVHQQSWAKYALWYNSGPGALYFKSGEVFNGPVHANTFIYLQGNPVFNALLSSTKSSWGEFSASAVFNQGFQLSAPAQSMSSINFTSMMADASLVLTGNSSLVFSGTNVLISNAGRGWTQYCYALPLTNASIYVLTNSANGKVSVGGTLDGRLSVVSAYDIWVTNHVRYAVHPTNGSDDALGLIARHDVIVRNNAPDDVEIFAHIIAQGSATSSTTDGSFYVQDYDSGDPRGGLNVYGGIVQYYRGAVGQYNSMTMAQTHGFYKNYCFDTRFETDPPPYYPRLTNEYKWKDWRDKSR